MFSLNISCKVSDGESGIWSVRTANPKDLAGIMKLRGLGTIKILFREEKPVMTSTPVDISDLKPLWQEAKGSVLLTGLGLGCAIQLIINKPEVTDITVIEKEIDVIRLVAPSYIDDKIHIIHADAFTWSPPEGKIYDYIWHDIFNFKNQINKNDIIRLQNKYTSIAKKHLIRGYPA